MSTCRQLFFRLIPGVLVAPRVVASIDANGDRVLSEVEQRAYAERVLGDLSITVDGRGMRPMLVSQKFPAVEEMREGLGEIQIEFTVELPSGGVERRMVFENHHQSGMSVYLMNCLVPRVPEIRILGQSRNENQSLYVLDYQQSGAAVVDSSGWNSIRGRMGAVGFGNIFRLGMRHIAEGTDHLLFLLALLLPAPLLALSSRWAGFAGARHSLLQILRVVTAFTVGHSITLALAALGVVRAPSRPMEVLIAVSILVSAAHAIRPLFPGREARIAALFGLLHGLAFASTLGELGLGRWERVSGILAFNLGIEAMQLIVVAAVMPSLVLLSQTRGYAILRLGGALFAGFASAGWIAERLLNEPMPVDWIVGGVAQRAGWIAGTLMVLGIVSRWLRKFSAERAATLPAGSERHRTVGPRLLYSRGEF
jgi:HupE / UreJ protein